MLAETIMAGALIAGPCRTYGKMTICGTQTNQTTIYQRGNDYQIHRPNQPIQNFYQYGNTLLPGQSKNIRSK